MIEIKSDKKCKYGSTVTHETYLQFKKACGPITDTIQLSNDLAERLDDVYPLLKEKHVGDISGSVPYCPCDIVISKTVPIQNLEFEVNGSVCRVHIIDSWVDALIDEVKDDPHILGPKFVGYMEIEEDMHHPNVHITVGCPLIIFFSDVPGADDMTDEITIHTGGLTIKPHAIAGVFDNLEASKELYNILASRLIEWYRIQLTLLNPLTKVCFREYKLPVHSTNKNRKSKRPIRYVRRLVLDSEEFDKAINPDKSEVTGGSYIRRTMIWHVAGHWRKNKNGTRSFIKGYWKGPLRDLEKNKELFESRNRELVV